MFEGAIGRMVSKLQETGHIAPQAQCDGETEALLVKLILGIPNDVAAYEDIIALFGEDYTPGTFMIGEIENAPDFFLRTTEAGYEGWVKHEIQDDLQRIKAALTREGHPEVQLDEIGMQRIEQDVFEVLNHRLENGKRLCDLVALQEYTDVFRRVILVLLTGDPEIEIDTYAGLNTAGRELALSILSRIDGLSLFELLKVSIASGLLGLNMKTSASATSKIFRRNIIPIHLHMSPSDQVERITRQLIDKAQEEMAISYWSEYEREVLVNQGRRIAFFTDDYIETIFDLRFIEKQLHYNTTLTVDLIPRFMRYGNDASYTDVMSFLEEASFKDARSFYNNGRLRVCRHGPRSGTTNGSSISQDVANILRESDCVVVKGARSYEMLQGIKKVAYFGFAVCREISESVTGIDAEKGQLVFIRQAPGVRSFEGFKQRRQRCQTSDSGRNMFLSATTAKDHYRRHLGLDC